jgi:hypothetical protein
MVQQNGQVFTMDEFVWQTEEEERERDAIEASAQRLPDRIQPVPGPKALQGVCRYRAYILLRMLAIVQSA